MIRDEKETAPERGAEWVEEKLLGCPRWCKEGRLDWRGCWYRGCVYTPGLLTALGAVLKAFGVDLKFDLTAVSGSLGGKEGKSKFKSKSGLLK